MFEIELTKRCRALLDAALKIAIRSNSDGEEARILHEMALLAPLMGVAADSSEVVDLEARAKLLKTVIEAKFGLLEHAPDNAIATSVANYNHLLCLFQR
jgi:hypothetical protein